MAVEVYKGRLYRHGHERRALGQFLQALKSNYKDLDELYIVVFEVDIDGAEVDLLLLGPRTMIIADFKELTAATEKDSKFIQISGMGNGVWEYCVPGNIQPTPLGGFANKDKNPYKQIEQMRYVVAKWLALKSTQIIGKRWKQNDALDHLNGWVILSPGFDGSTDRLELPWEAIRRKHNWFRVIPLQDLAWEFHCTTDLHFKLTEREMRSLVEHLGATKVNNLGEVLPQHFPYELPPVAPSFLFSPPPPCCTLIGRDEKITEIMGYLKDPTISIISIEGMGGIGKTSILGCLAKEAGNEGWQTKYIACREKELTVEIFLAGVAADITDRVMAHLILDKEIPLIDRLDVAFNYLAEKNTLLIIDDFQKVSTSTGIAPVITRAPQHTPGLKVILASREHPELIDRPGLPFGVARSLPLNGLSREEISFFFDEHHHIDIQKIGLDQQRLKWVWERTNGNPYAIRLLKPLIDKYGWIGIVEDLPLYQNDKDQWFDSLVETLEKDARQLAYRISVIRTLISEELIAHLLHDPKKAKMLTFELVDKYILQYSELDGHFSIHDYVREYLYDHFNDPKQRTKAHLDGGNYYKHLAKQATNEYQAGDSIYEAIYHFDQANQEDEILQLSQQAFLSLYARGAWDRAQIISIKALKAARTKNQPVEIARWLVHTASWEFDHDQIKEAGLHLQQALSQLSNLGSKTLEQEKRKILEIRANISVEKARVAYYTSEFDQATEHLLNAIPIIKEISNDELMADCLMRIARIERQNGDFHNSRLHFEEARQIAEMLEDDQIYTQAISHLGLIARQENDYHTAQQLFSEAYQHAKKVNDWRGMEIHHSLLADLARRQGDFASAAEIFQECLNNSRRVGNGVAIRINLGQLAESLIRMGKLDEAKPYLEEVKVRCQNAGDGIGMAWTIYRKGLLLKKQGEPEGGDKLIYEAIDKLREIGSEVYIRDFEKDLGPVQVTLPGF